MSGEAPTVHTEQRRDRGGCPSRGVPDRSVACVNGSGRKW
ncbi:hypothetical protein G0U57_020294 [Chelydra serpentina]|uniref:Uncharacterized protein n=1 Tax=Chelydra serpentina TaxID=8475 RepID=A0A8T1S321_CHESE|nr:hypothetical protein G0U57_020294 [Chelydra serpentina]